ncbi:MAG: radical SAM protein [Clostridia bacterium]|nr:radical SAM protein [Clostridia bacterium]
METLVSHIERCSTFDGPGIRTVVFLKGCPLKCKWCHNPELISFEKEELFYPEKCIKCGGCKEGCYSGARVTVGKIMSVDEIVKEVEKDMRFYVRGGATISGGEPLSHGEFLKKLIPALKSKGVNVGVETSLYRYDEEILRLFDVIMADIKIFDDELHKEYVGVGVKGILDNFLAADKLGVPIIVRTPVIAGVNDDEENVKKTSQFAKSLKNAVRYELLPYHSAGVKKALALNKPQAIFAAPTDEKLELLKKYTF